MSTELSFYEESSPPGLTGIRAWLLTHDHKRIGLLYLWASLFWVAIALVLGILIRTELMAPGVTIMDPQVYNAAFTVHGVIMIFLFVIPAIPAILGNFLLPLHLGTDDVFFPRLNLFSWYLYMLGGVTVLGSLFTGGLPDTGWTFYVPFSTTTPTGVGFTAFAAFILGFSSMLTGINFITTFHRKRMPGMKWHQIPLFPWSLYATAWIQVLATPILSITLVIIIFERIFGTGLFDPAQGGDPILYQHLFWMYSHPAVYIMILPGMGIVSEILAVFARKAVFGYNMMVASSLAIAIAGSLVWAHHMFTSGMSDVAVFVFSLLTYIVAIPSAIKVFNWLATLYKGAIEMSPPLLYSLCFIYLFSVGGLTGLVLGSAGTDIHVHDTHFVVGHFHFVMFGGTGFAFIAGLHFWWPKIFGKMYRFRQAYLACALLTTGFMFHYVPMLILGVQGMPRRYYDYLPQFATGNYLAGIGGWIMIAGIVLMTWNFRHSLKHGEPAVADPWGGTTFEWSTPSPPPVHNFIDMPELAAHPYDFAARFNRTDEGDPA